MLKMNIKKNKSIKVKIKSLLPIFGIIQLKNKFVYTFYKKCDKIFK